MDKVISQAAYFSIAALSVLWLVSLIQFYKPHPARFLEFLKSHGLDLIFSFALAAIIFVTVKPDFRVLNDETNLLNVARSMYYERDVRVIEEANWEGPELKHLTYKHSSRPLLFPFYVHLFHLLLGYSVGHIFLANFMALGVVFYLLCRFLRPLIGTVASFSAVLLVAAQPIVSLSATSGHYDVFNLCFFLIAFLSLDRFLREPSRRSFIFVWLSFLMQAHIRNEAFLFLIVIVLGLCLFRFMKWKYLATFLFPVSVLVQLPLWYDQWRKSPFSRLNAAMPQGSEVFSLANFFHHNQIFLKALFHFDFYLPYASVVNIIGILGIGLFWIKQLRRKTFLINRVFATETLALSTYLVVLWALYSSLVRADMSQAQSARFYLVFCVTWSLFAVYLGTALPVFRRWPVFIFLISLAFFFIYHPVAIRRQIFKDYDMDRYSGVHRSVMDFLNGLRDDRFLLVTPHSTRYVAYNLAAIQPWRAAKEKKYWINALNKKELSHIYMIETVNKRMDTARLPERWGLSWKPVYIRQSGPDANLLISEVKVPEV